MNLLGTLAKVAIGAMVARGVGKAISGSGNNASGGGGGLGGMLGSVLGSGQQGSGQGGGGLGGLLGGLLGGGQQSQLGQGGGAGGAGGLGGLLGGLVGGASRSGGGLGGMLGKVLSGGGGAGGAAGGLGGLLEGLGGGAAGGRFAGGAGSASGAGSLGGLLNQAIGGQATPEPTAEQNNQAEILLRAMINSAKVDGEVDKDEQQQILQHLGDASQEEVAFVRDEMAKPLDVDAFINSIPQGMEQQVYLMSLMAIKLDSKSEAEYLDQLAKRMNISHAVANEIHAKLGVPNLYS